MEIQDNELALGIDIGGTNIAFGLVTKTGQVIFEESVPTLSFQTASDFIHFVFNHIQINQNLASIIGIGIGAPNGNHFTGEIENAPNLPWKGIIPLQKITENQFNCFVTLTNDANAAAVGEQLFGNAKDLSNFITITLGTGLGSGIVINNELIYGEHGIAGEFGHIRIIPDGRLCKCGRKGCLETYASSTGVVRSFHELNSHSKQYSSLAFKENIDAHAIFKAAQEGDIYCMEIVEFTAQILGSSLADFIAFSDPKAYVLFGGIAQSGSFFADKVKIYLEQNVLNIFKNKVEIRISDLHNQNAAILGNAAMVFRSLSK